MAKSKQQSGPALFVPTPVGEIPAANAVVPKDTKAQVEATSEATVSPLGALADRLEALAKEAQDFNEPTIAKYLSYATRSARRADKQRKTRLAKQAVVGKVVAEMVAKGLSAEQIVAALVSNGK